MTRTYTQLFSDEAVIPLVKELDLLTEDWHTRSRFADQRVLDMAERRFSLLRTAIDLLTDRAD